MRRRLSLAALVAAFTLALLPHAQAPAVAALRASGKIVARQVDHSMPAFTVGDVRRQDGGRVDAPSVGTTGGGTLSVTSPVIEAGQLFERIGVHFRATPGSEDSMIVEVRASPDGARWTEWRSLRVDEDLGDEATGTWYVAPQPVPADSRFAQYRVWLTDGEPAHLVHVALTFLDVNDLGAGPVARLVSDVRGALTDAARSFGAEGGYALGAAEATGASRILTRQDWGADESLMKWTPKYVPVKKAIVHHTVTDDGGTNVAATIRAVYYFHAVTRGWGDIGYNYIVDKFGNIWTGRQGGDNVVGGHAYGWNDGTIGVAALGDYGVTAPTGQLQGAIANVISLRFKQLGIAPFGSGSFTHQEQRSDGSWVDVTATVPNVLGHRDCAYVVGQAGGLTSCPGGALYGMLGGLRSLAQSAWQDGYTYLTRIDPQLAPGGFPGQQIAVPVLVTNLGTATVPAGTLVNYRLLRLGSTVAQGAGTPLPQPLAPGAAASVMLPFTAPAAGEYVVRWDLQSGGSWWSALTSSPFRDTWFRSADWSASWTGDTVTRTWTAGETRMVTATVQNDGGRTWNATGLDPVRLGYYWISTATGNRFDGQIRQPLAQDVPPGQTVTLALPVTAPAYPTNYTMILDLYKENEFWFKDKGLAPDDTPTSVGVDAKAAYSVGAPLPTFAAGKTATVPLTIVNRGRGTFPTTTSAPVALGYHWYDASGATVVWDGARTPLPVELGAGQSVTVGALVTAPARGGPMTLRFDLVQEGVGWFSGKGVPTADLSVTVEAPLIPSYGAAYQPAATTFAQSGALAAVPITVTNTSNFAWPAAGASPVDLGYHWATVTGQTLTWDGLRTKLPSDVPPGASATVQAQVAVPTAQGAYTLRWDMVQEGVAWFSAKGVRTFDQSIAVGPPPFYGGSMDVSTVPGAMPVRMTTTAPLVVQNMSNFTWGAGVALAYHWYDAAGNVVVWDGARTPLAGMAPGDLRAVSAPVQGPASPGAYTLRFDVVQEGVTWFSGQGMQLAPIAVAVSVPQYGALYVGPDAIAGAATAGVVVPVTLANVGTLPWQTAVVNLSYHLVTAAGAVVLWDGQRTPLSQTIGPGQTAVVNAFVKLPAAGTYALRWDLVQEGVTWFSGQGVPTAASALTIQ